MAVFSSTCKIKDTPLYDLIGTPELPDEDWKAIQKQITQGGKRIIDLRGRSSFQSPAYLSISMIAAAMGGEPFTWPVGAYHHSHEFEHILMALNTTLNSNGVKAEIPNGLSDEMMQLKQSYAHLKAL